MLAKGLLGAIFPKISLDKCNFELLKPPNGRFDFIKHKDSYIVVDYAHTPDAVESTLCGVRRSFLNYKIISIIGCGGDRDKTKRQSMSCAACENSDFVYMTSDNPRGESPADIIEDMICGIKYNNYTVMIDRRDAIIEAISNLKSMEILLILGKGHENYQEIAGIKMPFNDKQVVLDFISSLSKRKKKEH